MTASIFTRDNLDERIAARIRLYGIPGDMTAMSGAMLNAERYEQLAKTLTGDEQRIARGYASIARVRASHDAHILKMYRSLRASLDGTKAEEGEGYQLALAGE